MLIQHLRENPEIPYEQLAAKMGKSRVTVSRKISELKKAGKIKYIDTLLFQR
ncbi:winged helix-turn-helix transcriptional regulator [Treponema sp. HNW]|uniref:winged helix-turn-helix transcriptional regulator n=1 Tax=Treponema sp. HNW TaxID=3116654 RepID=UPI003D0C8209